MTWKRKLAGLPPRTDPRLISCSKEPDAPWNSATILHASLLARAASHVCEANSESSVHSDELDVRTMDHCSVYDGGMQCFVNGNVAARAVRGTDSALEPVYPTTSESVDDATMTLRACIGDSHVERLCSDNADELTLAARNLEVPHEASQQGTLQTHAIVEREVKDTLTGARTRLVAVGLPVHVWFYAAPCYVHLGNCLPHPRSGQSA